MMDQINTTKMTAKSISEQLSDIWPKLSRNQRRFVVASQEYASKKDAAEAIGIKHDTVYRWPKIIDEAIFLMAENIKEASLDILASSAAKAAMIKITGLDSGNEKIRQEIAIINFYPKGYSDRAVIHVEDGHDNRYSYLIEPFLPHVKIKDEYIEF